MEIHGLGQIHGAQSIRGPHRIEPQRQVDTSFDVTPMDQVEISAEAELISQVHDLPEMRFDRIDQIRGELETGIYETDDKLDVALGRLLDEIG